jgi:hypothetical protein
MVIALAGFGLWKGALVGLVLIALWGLIVVGISARWRPAEVTHPAR